MKKIIGAFAAALFLGACVTDPPPQYLVASADPALAPQRIRAATVTAGIKTFRVTGPANWQELNRRVGPKGGAGGVDHSNMPGMKMEKAVPAEAPPRPAMDHSRMPGMKSMPGMK